MSFNIILDLDQTLISAETIDDFDFSKNNSKAKKFVFHDMDNYYIVFERPGLQSFLDYLFENFNVSVWTAASHLYAMFIIEKILLKKKNRKLDWVFFSYHCDISKKEKNGSKDLSILWDLYKLDNFNNKNTIILDDYDEVADVNGDNCILVKPFEFEDPKSYNDRHLKELKECLKTLKIQDSPAKEINERLKIK